MTEDEVRIGGYHPHEFKQLVDSAFGVPRFEMINFRLIHTLFHVIAEKAEVRASGVILQEKFDDLKVLQGENLTIKDLPSTEKFDKIILVGSDADNIGKDADAKNKMFNKNGRYEQEGEAYGEGYGHDFGKDGAGFGKDGVAYGQDGAGYGMDGAGYGLNGSGFGKDGAGYGQDGSGYGKDGAGFGKDGSGYGQDGAGYGKDGSGYGKDGDGYGRDGAGYGRDGEMGLGLEGKGRYATCADLELRVLSLEQALDDLAKALALCCNQNGPSGTSAIRQLENEMNEKLDGLRNELLAALNDLQDQICQLEQQIGGIMNDIQDIFGCLEDHFNKIESVEKQLESLLNKFMCVQSDVNSLLRERKCRERQIEEIIEQLEAIKVMKANKDSMMRMLDLKEDKTVVRTKLDANIFNCYQKEFSANLKVIHEKLILLKEDIRNEVDPILTTLDTKASKMDLCAVKEIIEMQINSANDQIENIVRLRMNPEGPITAEKYARNLNCTVCEDNVLMKTTLDTHNIPKGEESLMKLSRSVVTAQPKCGLEVKNYRSCGGKFTIMSSTDRIIRRGHFLKQFNIPPTNTNEHFVEGDDGCIYKGNPPEWPCDKFVTVKDNVRAGH